MCGRFVVYSAGAQLRDVLGIPEAPTIEPRYNVAVTDPVPSVRASPAGHELVALRWGLIPGWADDAKIGQRCFNARAESAERKPAFRDAFRKRRCLVLANGFYEWQNDESARKQPWYFHRVDGRPLAFAGLWERNTRLGSNLESCAILTTRPNELVEPFHDRMPVILAEESWRLWLDPKVEDPETVRPLLLPFSAERMTAHRVDPIVNDVRSQGAALIHPYEVRQGSLF